MQPHSRYPSSHVVREKKEKEKKHHILCFTNGKLGETHVETPWIPDLIPSLNRPALADIMRLFKLGRNHKHPNKTQPLSHRNS